METTPKFRKRKKNLLSCVCVLHTTSHREISCFRRVLTAKQCTKKCNVRAKLLFCLLSLLLFWTFSLPLPSSSLKLPNVMMVARKVIYSLMVVLVLRSSMIAGSSLGNRKKRNSGLICSNIKFNCHPKSVVLWTEYPVCKKVSFKVCVVRIAAWL